MKYYLHNPRSNNGAEKELPKEEYSVVDIIGLDYKKFFSELKDGDEVVLSGGDGTINYLINAVDCDKIKNKIYFEPAGTGNDFARDLGIKAGERVLLNDYIKNLPTVEVNGMKKKFIDGIGFGVDGYCCEVADKMRAQNKTDIDYTAIAVKGVLFNFSSRKATVTVDGKTYEHKHTWIAASMKGRYYGGGMMVAPAQDRKGKTLSLVVYKSASRLAALIVFPSIFKGEHIKKEKMVKVYTGSEIEVTFSKPCALQIDGDTVLNVSSYKVHI